MRVKQWWVLGLGLLLAIALAQSRNDIRLDLKAFRVLSVQEQGRTVEKLEAALDAKPGQLIEYQLSAQNTTDNPLRQVASLFLFPPAPPIRL